MLTIYEHFGRMDGLKVAFVGDGNNVAASLAQACAHLGTSRHRHTARLRSV
jgi:ornithine carbamoyltransferase